MNPLVSVLIPAYNHEKYVQDTIKSILEQTYQNIELIVIDDGSKDSTWQKIQDMKSECEKRFTRVHFETKQNEGNGATVNKLLSLSKGDYIYFIASDDMVKPEAIEKEVNFLAKNPDYVLITVDNELINENNIRVGWGENFEKISLQSAPFKTVVQKMRHNFSFMNYDSNDFGDWQKLLKGNHVPNGYLIRATALKNFRLTQEAPLADFYMMLQLSKKGKFKYLDEVLYSYRWHGANTMNKEKHIRKISIRTYLYEKKLLEQNNDKERLKIFIDETENYRMKFRIGNFIKYYRHNAINYKENILEIFGKKIQVKYKNFLED